MTDNLCVRGKKNQLHMISYSDELQFSTILLQRMRTDTLK